MSFAHDGDAGDDDCGEWFVVGVAFNACDRAYEQNRVCIAKTKDGVFSVELGDGLLCDEELATVGAATGGPRARVGHGEEARLVEAEGGVDLVLEEVAGIPAAITSTVATLNHEGGDDAMEGGAVVKGLIVYLLQRFGIGPVLGALGKTNKVGDSDRSLFFEELAGETAHGRVNDGSRTCGYSWGLELAGGTRGVGKLLGGWGRLCLRGYAEGQDECKSTKRHAVFDSNKQAIADTRLEQCYGLTETVVMRVRRKNCPTTISSLRFNCENLYLSQDFWHLTELEEQLYGEVCTLRVVEG